MSAFPPPKKKDIQIRHLPDGNYKVRCRHGWEKADRRWFALILWAAAWTNKETHEPRP